MIPFEVITMLGSSLFTGLLSIWSQKSKDAADQQIEQDMIDELDEDE